MQGNMGPRSHHDADGNLAGKVPKVKLPRLDWEKQVEIIRSLLGDTTCRIVSVYEVRHGFESFGIEKYNMLSFYRRGL